MTKPSTGEVIELHLDNELWLQRLPFHRMLCAPTTQAAGSLASEAWWLHHFPQSFR